MALVAFALWKRAMPPEVDSVAALLDPEVLGLPGRIVAGFATGDDPERAANALTALSLNLWLARRRLAAAPAPEVSAVLDRLDVEVQSAMQTLRDLTGVSAEPDFG